jgi:hypothetical protein
LVDRREVGLMIVVVSVIAVDTVVTAEVDLVDMAVVSSEQLLFLVFV